uniref:L-threonylcarbamoyladenylate synthase n=1 Tax=Pararhizobium sp. IMCC3301 TaxID=3067904 RepID=UPI002740B5FF|nr:L-threonylcarbamoyladenylate synthase [Pararhizobium sp. IMCC3301]
MSQNAHFQQPGLARQSRAAAVSAAELLKSGNLVGLPTETVYGLAADATSDRAVARIYAAKNRPDFNPLICHVDSVEMARTLAAIDERAQNLIDAFWPGGLTLVLPQLKNAPVSELVTAGLGTIALRCPDNSFVRSLITSLQVPLAAPSANPSGMLSPTSAHDVRAAFPVETVPLVVDGGNCPVGLESTIVACIPGTPVTLLRPGAITSEQLQKALPEEAILTHRANAQDQMIPAAPGMLSSHYAPRAAVRLISAGQLQSAPGIGTDDAVLTFAGAALPGDNKAAARLDLSPSGDLVEAAANLFSMLRQLDRAGPQTIYVVPPPRHGLGVAIYDRLQRAAAPRNNELTHS